MAYFELSELSAVDISIPFSVILKDNVNYRNEPRPGPKAGTIPKGTTIRVVGKEGKWFAVEVFPRVRPPTKK